MIAPLTLYVNPIMLSLCANPLILPLLAPYLNPYINPLIYLYSISE